MKTRVFILLTMLLALHIPAFGQYIEIHVSVKVIVDPTNGSRPPGITDDLLYKAAANANTASNWMPSYWRGYRFRIKEIKDIGGPSQRGASGPSKWYGRDPRGDWEMFQTDTNTDPLYLLHPNWVNFYITMGATTVAGGPGGACPFPWESGKACFAIVEGEGKPWWLVHETGHFFGLFHTFGGSKCSDSDPKGENTRPGDDGITDTLPDVDCWTREQIESNARSTNYNNFNSLPASVQRKLVDDTFINVMSYHANPENDRLTELQLDRHADTANSTRAAYVSGRTRFVSLSGSDSGAGCSTSPYRSVLKAVTDASSAGGDIILLRPGAYNEPLTINKPCTLRATRAGPVSIGSPAAP
jgi:hypothetical protein